VVGYLITLTAEIAWGNIRKPRVTIRRFERNEFHVHVRRISGRTTPLGVFTFHVAHCPWMYTQQYTKLLLYFLSSAERVTVSVTLLTSIGEVVRRAAPLLARWN
jgi:hypothetical protein